MKWEELLAEVGVEPVFSSGLLLSGGRTRAGVRLQLSRWTKAGRLQQLRRGLYCLAEPYRKVMPHPFLVSNRLKRGSYVSLQSALSHYGLIPEHVPVVTAVTTGRPEKVRTPDGVYVFRHIKKSLFAGYRQLELTAGQRAFMASPEKALLDLIWLTPDADGAAYLRELRLQNMEGVDRAVLMELAERSGSSKLRRAAARIADMA